MNKTTDKAPVLSKADKARLGKIKWECHRLMDIIWGTGKKARAKAYCWVDKNIGIKHFSDIQDYELAWAARKALQAEALKEELLTIEELSHV